MILGNICYPEKNPCCKVCGQDLVVVFRNKRRRSRRFCSQQCAMIFKMRQKYPVPKHKYPKPEPPTPLDLPPLVIVYEYAPSLLEVFPAPPLPPLIIEREHTEVPQSKPRKPKPPEYYLHLEVRQICNETSRQFPKDFQEYPTTAQLFAPPFASKFGVDARNALHRLFAKFGHADVITIFDMNRQRRTRSGFKYLGKTFRTHEISKALAALLDVVEPNPPIADIPPSCASSDAPMLLEQRREKGMWGLGQP